VPLGFGRTKNEDVISLIANKDYGRAIEVLRAQLKKRGASTTLRKQLADVLELSGKTKEAVALLLPLADQFAREGFAAKAVAILKKIQKIDPGRRDVEERLAQLIEEKQREAVVPYARAPEIGIEEIGIAPAADASDTPAPGGPEIGIASPAPPPAPREVEAASEPSVVEEPIALPPPPAPEPVAPAATPPSPPPGPPTLPAPDEPLPVLTPMEEPPAPAAPAAPAPAPAAAPAAAPEGIEDYDLMYEGGEDDDEGEEVLIEVEPMAEAAPMSDGAFADELMSLVDSVFQEAPAAPQPVEPSEAPATGSQIVVSPLFRDFAVDEMVAVIHGLKLLSFERGEVIIREGAAGSSLYTLTSGRVRAFRRDRMNAKQVQIGDLKEGAFFGEMSILTGQPRTASVVALTRCELLELDRDTLDDITSRHPHVWDVLREFAEQRSRARG